MFRSSLRYSLSGLCYGVRRARADHARFRQFCAVILAVLCAAPSAVRAQDGPLPLSPLVRQKYAPRTVHHEDLNRAQMLAIETSLQWLSKHQDDDGHWDCDGFMKHDAAGKPCDGPGNATHDVGVTGLALLAFLASNHTLRNGAYSDNVTKAVRWLKDRQRPSGLIGSNAQHDFLYDHAIAAVAIVEAYGLSNDKSLRPAAQKALDYLEVHRNPKAVWRYQPRDGDNDISVTIWCTAAYAAGKDFQLRVNEDALSRIGTYLDSITDPTGRHGYAKRGHSSSRKPGEHGKRFPVDKCETMTAVGWFCRFLLGHDLETDAAMQPAADLIVSKPPVKLEAATDYYYWYYGSLAMFQVGGTHWDTWSQNLRTALLPAQRVDGNFAGSWDPASVWGDDGGRVYTTAVATMALQVEFRYARMSALLPLPDDAVFRAANATWRSMDFGKFQAKLDAAARNKSLTEEQGRAIALARETLAAKEERILAEVARAKTGRAYFTAPDRLEQIEQQFRRLAPAKAARDLLSEWKRDPAVKKERLAMKRFESIKKKAKPDARGQVALRKALVKFIHKYAQTTAGKQASKLVSTIR
ncbi:MAG: hypothetical protein ACI89X_003697 [Planctomycetota bacterium]|jgi:hypothetical protein